MNLITKYKQSFRNFKYLPVIKNANKTQKEFIHLKRITRKILKPRKNIQVRYFLRSDARFVNMEPCLHNMYLKGKLPQ